MLLESRNIRGQRKAKRVHYILVTLKALFAVASAGAVHRVRLGLYELNQVDLLLDVFVWAYERSGQQYVAVQQSLVTPDILRLRYRQVLGEVIAAVVRFGQPINGASINAMLPGSVQPEDREHSTQLVLKELTGLQVTPCVLGCVPLSLLDGGVGSCIQKDRPGMSTCLGPIHFVLYRCSYQSQACMCLLSLSSVRISLIKKEAGRRKPIFSKSICLL